MATTNNPNLAAIRNFASKFSPEILGKMYRELALQAWGIRVYSNIQNELILPRMVVGKGLKPYSGVFAAEDNQLIYSDRSLVVAKGQRDIAIDVEKYRTTYLALMAGTKHGSNANKQAQIPFAQFVWGELMKENGEEVAAIMYGGQGKDAYPIFNAGTAYAVGNRFSINEPVYGKTQTNYYRVVAATTAGQTPTTHPAKFSRENHLAIVKGFGKIFQDAIANEGFANVVSTGVITSVNAYDQFTAIWRSKSDLLRAQGANMYISQNLYEMLMDAYEDKVSKNFETTNGITHLAKTDKKCAIVPVSWLAGSNRIICCKANNLALGTNELNDLGTLTVKEEHYDLEASMTFLLGLQVSDLDDLTINDQN